MRSILLTALVTLGALFPTLVAPSGAAGQERSREEPELSLASNLVEVLVTVVDAKGRPVGGLTRSSFEIFEDGARQEIAHFDDRGPLALGVVLDATGMAPETVDATLGALRRSRLVAERAAEVSFVAFNARASIAMNFVATADRVLPELTFSNARRPPTIREAIARAETALRAAPGSRKLVLIITEGGASVGPREIANGVEGGRAQLYAVFPTAPDTYRGQGAEPRLDGGAAAPWWRAYSFDAVDRNVTRAAVSSIARRSGGRALYALPAGDAVCVDLFDKIGDETTSQYMLGYYPSSTSAGWHRVAVRLVPKALGKGLAIRHRSGYRVVRPEELPHAPARQTN
jgi:VWFA-related protein